MNRLVYFFFLLIVCSCKSNIGLAQEEKVDKTVKPIIEKPKYTGNDHRNDPAPNIIKFTGKVIRLAENESICGKTYGMVAVIYINTVTSSGRSIVNRLYPGQEVSVAFMSYQTKNKKQLKEVFSTGQKVLVEVSEGLCPDMSSTMYKVMTFKTDDG